MAFASWIRNWRRSLERRWALHQTLRRRSIARRHAIRPRLESLEDRWLLSTYLVTSGGDTNTSGTLRFGINQANNSANGITEIDFKVNGGGAAQTITLTSQLPTLSASSVYINGLTQGGTGNTIPLITLNGTGAGSGSDGLLITGASNTVSGLILSDFGSNGIEVDAATNIIGGTTAGAGNIISGNTNAGVQIDTNVSGVQLLGNYIGTDTTGTKGVANGIGVLVKGVSDTIGGTTGAARNIISGNSNDGVLINGSASGVQVQGNYIGTNAAGTGALANLVGVEAAASSNTIGGTAGGARNVISGNSNSGIAIDSGVSGVGVQGNFIGLDETGGKALANSIGINDAGTGNTLGGSVNGARNNISGNSTDGILLGSSASGETVQSNYIGLSHAGNAVLANGGNGVEVQGVKNTIGGNSASSSLLRNYITGNGNDGVLIDSGATGNQVLGNFIGLDLSGTNGLGNAGNGVEVAGNGNTIGGTTAGLGNTISGSSKDGVLVDSAATGNLVVGNDVGTDYTGKKAVANSGSGIEVMGTADTLGGTASAARNVISANSGNGVQIDSSASGTLVQGNYIGLNASGAALGNGGNGISIGGKGNTVGGTVSGARNIISANTDDGVLLASVGSGNLVVGNYIGTDTTGSNALGNSGNGIEIAGIKNTIGGTASAARNIISGNLDGVQLDSGASNNQVLGDYIGTNAAGTAALSNEVGIADYGSGNSLGGSVSGARNIISGNLYQGMLIWSSASGETVQGNYIGLSGSGMAVLANDNVGIWVEGNNNTIGGNSGSDYYTRNFISGNSNDGAYITSGATGNQVLGNFIGVDISGTKGLGNVGNGVEIAGNGNIIGGTASGLGNTISGNTDDGVLFDSGATSDLVVGNDVGTDYTGKNAVANSGSGIEVAGNGNTVGGTATAARNVIAANSGNGVAIDSGASGTLVEGNYLGLNAAAADLGNGYDGISIAGNKNTVGGTVSGARNIISANTDDGVLLGSGGSGNLVLGNYIGTDPTGSTALGNSTNGIEIASNSNTVGGTTSASRNYISANSKNGVLIDSGASGNQVQGNYIGLNTVGTGSLANGVGIEDAGTGNVLGGSVSGGRNVISGNSNDGILLDGIAKGETIEGNFVGLTGAGNAALANGGNGVEVKGVNNTIGGNSGSSSLVRNYLTGNGDDGMLIDSGATGNQVLGNFIGLDISGTNGLGNVGNGVEIAGNGNTLGGTVSGLGNSISGNTKDGVLLDSTATGNLVVGNEVGMDYTGKIAVTNSDSGVEIVGNGNTLGGTAAAARNIIAANNGNGVSIDSGASGNLVLGNYIGLNAAAAALGNGNDGISIAGNNNTVGGTVSGARNIISANTDDGVLLASGGSGDLVLGNYIGTDATGGNVLGNGGNGVEVAGNSNTIGGTASAARNIISANSNDGVLIDRGASGNQVQGNYIGTNAAGTAALANSAGIEVAGSSNTLGGSVSGAKNVISGNAGDGVLIDSSGSDETVQGNYIGLDETGKAILFNGSNGVEVQGNNNTIGGNSGSDYFTRNFLNGNRDGVLIDSGASGNEVLGNFIGLDISGTNGLGNFNGVEVAGNGNTIGGTVSGLGNSISGNNGDGMLFDGGSTGNLVLGNDIGTDYTGKNAVASGGDGIEIGGNNNTLGGTSAAARNVIAGNNGHGVQIDSGASGNLVLGNYLGLNISAAALGNGGYGIDIGGTGNTVGGTASGARNIISANNADGVFLASGGSGNQVLGNYIGLDPTGSFAKGNSGDGVEIAGNGNTIGGTASAARNMISANGNDGVQIDGSTSGNQVLGNYIGTNAAGSGGLGNGANGIEDLGGSGNALGGSVSGAKNVLSSNAGDGVLIDSPASADTVQGNYIGLGSSGRAALANGRNGVEALGNNNTIGGNSGSDYYTRNFITSNGYNGVYIGGSGNQVLGNFIGVDISGTNGRGNADNGVEIGGNGNSIGGTVSGLTNVISGSSRDGVLIDSGATGNLVAGDYIGTDYIGKNAVANSGSGIEVADNGNTVGGTASVARNIISANGNDGVLIDSSASGTLVEGNYIGLNSSSAALGNSSYGVEINGSNNTIGGSASGAANTIADNASGGELVSTGVGDTISRDSIFANGGSQTGPGIVLGNGGNNSLAAPALLSASVSGTTLTVKGYFTPPAANVTYTLEIFASPTGDAEGKVYLATFHSTPSNTNPQSFTYNISTSVTGTDPVITATLTDVTGDTSAFSDGVTTATGAWTAVGPAPITNGQNASNGPVSGRITGIAADPSNANIVYLAAADGGIWKTTNATAANPTWTPLTDNLTDASSNPIPEFMGAVAETDATSGAYKGNQIVYAGTGEANNSIDCFYGEGILVSTNGGQTWTLTTANGAFKGFTVSKIDIDPADPTGGTAYAAVSTVGSFYSGANGTIFDGTNEAQGNTGIWMTTNFGQTWTNTTASLDTSPNNNASGFEEWSDVVIDPHTPTTLYAAQGSYFGGWSQDGWSSNANGVYKSTNGGATWTLLTNCPNGTQDGRISLALYDDGTTDELLVSIASPDPSNYGLLYLEKSTNGGSTFTSITNNSGLVNYMGSQGWYDQTLAIDPADSNYIYAGGDMSTQGGIYGFTGGLMESFDGGNTWQDISTDNNYNGPHTDDHAVAFDANGNLLDGDDGGIWSLDNPTNSSTQAWTDLNTNLEITQFYGIGVDTTQPDVVYGGTQDNGTNEYTGSLGWTQVNGGDGGITTVDPTNHNRIYAEGPNVSLIVSTDAGSDWTTITKGIQSNSVDFIAPYALDASGNIYYGTDYLNFSKNQGTTWTQNGTPNTNGFNPNDNTINAIAVNPVANSNVVYVAASNEMFVTKNDQSGSSATWTEIDLPGNATSGSVTAHNTIAVDPSVSNGSTAYAVVAAFTGSSSGHVFKTTNYGGTWTDISGNLPDTPVDSVVVSSDGKTVYVGTDLGVYYTTNGGSTWSRFGTGLPYVQVVQLVLDPIQNLLVIGTHGRGVWEAVLPSSPSAPQLFSPTNQTGSKGATGQATEGGGNPTTTLDSLRSAPIGFGSGVPVVPVLGSSSGINLTGTSALANSPTNSSATMSNRTQTATGSSTAPIDDVSYALEFVANKPIDADSEDSVLGTDERSNQESFL